MYRNKNNQKPYIISESQGRKLKLLKKKICLPIFRIHIWILESESKILLNEYFLNDFNKVNHYTPLVFVVWRLVTVISMYKFVFKNKKTID